MKRNNFKRRVFAPLLLATVLAIPTTADAATKNLMCLKTNTGQYIEVVRVSMMAVADGQSTFEIVVRDGQGATNVSSVSFEKHASDLDLSAYQFDTTTGELQPNMNDPVWLITSTGKHYKVMNVTSLSSVGTDGQYNVVTNTGAVEKVRSVRFFRGKEENIPSIPTGIQTPQAVDNTEHLQLQTLVSQQLSLAGCGNAKTAVLYNTSGAQVGGAAVNNGSTTIQVGHLPAGIYIVKVGNKSLKFTKK